MYVCVCVCVMHVLKMEWNRIETNKWMEINTHGIVNRFEGGFP